MCVYYFELFMIRKTIEPDVQVMKIRQSGTFCTIHFSSLKELRKREKTLT